MARNHRQITDRNSYFKLQLGQGTGVIFSLPGRTCVHGPLEVPVGRSSSVVSLTDSQAHPRAPSCAPSADRITPPSTLGIPTLLLDSPSVRAILGILYFEPRTIGHHAGSSLHPSESHAKDQEH